MGAIGLEAARRSDAVLPVEVPLLAAQPVGVKLDPIGQRLNPPCPGSVHAFHGDGDGARAQIERHPIITDGVTLRRVPIHHHLHPVGVAPVDHPPHNPRVKYLGGRNQRLDFCQLGLLHLAVSTRSGRWGDRDHQSGTPL